MTKISHWIRETYNAIEVSVILYKKKKHLSSFEHFQEAVEKLNKAFAIFIDKYTLKQLKSEIGHEPVSYYHGKFRDTQEKFTIIKALGGAYPQIKDNELYKQINPDEEYLKGIEIVKDKFQEIIENGVKLTYKDLKSIVAHLQYLEEYKINGEMSEDEFTEGLHEVSAFFRLIGEDKLTQGINKFENSLLEPEQRKVFYEIMKYSMYIIPDFIFILYTCFCCAIITHKHYFKSRYPDEHSAPSDIYTKKHPIIKIQPALTELLEKAVFRLEELIAKTEINFKSQEKAPEETKG